MKYRVQVIADSTDHWAGNAATYDSAEAARQAAVDLFQRWLLVRSWRVVDENDEVHHSGGEAT